MKTTSERPIYECTGCGTVTRDPVQQIELYRKAGGLSCCPERSMVELSAKVEALRADLAQPVAEQQPVAFDAKEFARRAALEMEKHDFHGFEPVVLAVVEELIAAPVAQPDVAALVEALGSMTCAYRMAIQAGHARITALGGDCDSVEQMLSDFPDYGKAVELYKSHRAQQGGEE